MMFKFPVVMSRNRTGNGRAVEWADNLRGRLEFIGNKILLAEYRDQLGYDPDEENDDRK